MFELAILGVGTMGAVLAEAVLAHRLVAADKLLLIEPHEPSLSKFKNVARGSESTDDRISRSKRLLFCVKPQHFSAAAEQIRLNLPDTVTIISIMAGVSVQKIQSFFKNNPVIRSMPNLPLQIGRGVTGYYATANTSLEEAEFFESFFGKLGVVERFEKEDLLDSVLAVSGSGPGYVFYMMEQMILAAEGMGIPSEKARSLVIETFAGASELAVKSGADPKQLYSQVASKGGTTEAALEVFINQKLGKLLADGMLAAKARCEALNKL